MSHIDNSKSGSIVLDLIKVIQDNKEYLSEIDGAIGDGDHGINMNKGFTIAGENLTNTGAPLATSFKLLGNVLINEIGGSMGPLYGTLFRKMAVAIREHDSIEAKDFLKMLQNALSGIQQLSDAKVGDKTLMDTLVPAVQAFDTALGNEKTFTECLDSMSEAAEKGMRSTEDLVAKIGRASRLGERSRGVQDAGATSCCLLLQTLAKSTKERLSD